MQSLRFLLYPFSILYDGITGMRNWAFDKEFLKQQVFEIPVIAVGNLSTGGTGKTPMIEYLIRQFTDKRVAVLSRGYGRNTKGYLEVKSDHKAIEVGDEPLQIKIKFKNVIVAVCENRVDGINKLLESYNIDVVLLDDAFQHRYVKASQYILLSSFDKPFYDDYLLPAGDLRESRSGVNRAQHIIITKCPVDLDQKQMRQIVEKIKPKEAQRVYFSAINYSKYAVNCEGNVDLEHLKGKLVNVITGIAKPDYFIKFLQTFVSINHFKYPDHHNFTKEDISKFESDQIILTTEKDYVRLKESGLNNLYYVPIDITFLGDTPQINRSGN